MRLQVKTDLCIYVGGEVHEFEAYMRMRSANVNSPYMVSTGDAYAVGPRAAKEGQILKKDGEYNLLTGQSIPMPHLRS